jgi:hypothetical protein
VGQLVDQVGVHFIVDFVDELLVLFAQKWTSSLAGLFFLPSQDQLSEGPTKR